MHSEATPKFATVIILLGLCFSYSHGDLSQHEHHVRMRHPVHLALVAVVPGPEQVNVLICNLASFQAMPCAHLIHGCHERSELVLVQ